MTVRVGINGFGRIGRQALKAMLERYPHDLEVVAFNDLGNLDTMAHLFRYDSNYGVYPGTVELADGALIVDRQGDQGAFRTRPRPPALGRAGCADCHREHRHIPRQSQRLQAHRGRRQQGHHLRASQGRRTSPSCLASIKTNTSPTRHHVLSNASCTTNCLAPPAKVVNDRFGIQQGFMTTIHSYTNDQMILDLPHSDLRRARAAAVNMIPTSTGAAQAVALVVPELQGKFDGMAVRVPTPTGSLVDFVASVDRVPSKDELIDALEEAAAGPMRGYLDVSHEPPGLD